MFASIYSFTKNDPLCMAYHPYHFVGEVLLHTVYIYIYTHTEWTRRNATTTLMVERPLHAIGIACLPQKNGRDLRQNKFK